MAKKGKEPKVDKKKLDKLVEDKTFGLKSKKSKKVQNMIKQTHQAVLGKDYKQEDQKVAEKKKEKKKQAEEAKLLGFLQKTMGKEKKKKKKDGEKDDENPDAADEEDKYDSKTASINIYVDPREPDPTRSEKVCEDFIEACEKNVYGWGWRCPNGGAKCIYTHALPEGYMLKSTMEALMKMQQEESGDQGKSVLGRITEERAKLDPDKCTKVTKESFEEWHKKRREKLRKMRKKKDEEMKLQVMGKGSKSVYLSGRALMKFDANQFNNQDDDDGDEEEDKYEKPANDDDGDILELRFGIDEEEEELNKEIEAAKKMKGIDQELFNEDDADDVDLDDLE